MKKFERWPHIPSLLIFSALAAVVAAGSCGKEKKSATEAAKNAEAALFTPDPYTPVPGDEATQYFEPTLDAPVVDETATLNAVAVADDDAAQEGASLALTEADATVPQVDDATIGALKTSAPAKLAIDTASFTNATVTPEFEAEAGSGAGLSLTDPPKIAFDPTTYDYTKDKVALDAPSWGSQTQIVAARMTQIPVKNQGQRGTCAAHAGIGFLEYLMLKKYSSQLSTVDLSEQRFYYLAKPNQQKTGGKTDVDAGSSFTEGFWASSGSVSGYPAPSNDQKYNIPLESDCPYNAKGSTNELQIPQAKGCSRGSVKVTSVSQTYYWKYTGKPLEWHSNANITAQNIFDFVKSTGLPAPVFADITAKWAKNDGMITEGREKTGLQVLGGHGFLIVGMKKIDEAKFPGEGGMCFLVKNSWGLGWGTNGLSCMTLAWWNKHRQKFPFDVALDVDADLDYIAPAKKLTVPSGANPPISAAPAKKATLALASDPRESSIEDVGFDLLDNPGEAVVVADDTAAPEPAAAPEMTADGYTVASLVTPEGHTVKALYKVEGEAFHLKGVYAGNKAVSADLVLGFVAPDKITYADEKRGTKIVGALDTGGHIKLCSQEYADLCNLNLVADSGQLLLGLTEAAFHDYDADPAAKYQPLVSFNNYAIEYAPVAGDAFVDVRLVLSGDHTNGLRLQIEPVSGKILYKAQAIGNYQKLALCSGDYRSVCHLVVSTADRTLHVFFKAK